MSCEYSISGHLSAPCVPTAAGYDSAFYLCTWSAFNASIAANEVTVSDTTDNLTKVVKFSAETTPTLKPLFHFNDPRTAIFSGSTKAKADSPLAVPYFTKTLQFAVDKNAAMNSSDKNGGNLNSKLVNVLSAGSFVFILKRTDGTGYEAFGALSPMRCTTVDQSLASDDTNSGMVTLTFAANEGDFAVAVDNTEADLEKFAAAQG